MALGQGGEGVGGELDLVAAHRVHAQPGEVVDRRPQPDRLGDGRGAGLELPGQDVGRPAVEADVGDHLAAAEEGGHGVEQLLPAPQHADAGGPAHLVAGEGEQVAAQLAHVGGQVGDVLRAVDEHDRPHRVGGVGQLADRVERAQHVGHGGDAHQPDPVEEAVEVVEDEGAVGGHREVAQLDARLLPQHEPGDEVGVVLHLGEQDGLARGQAAAAVAVGHQVDGLGGVLGEHDLGGRRGADEAGHLRPGLLEGGGGLLGQPVHAPVHVGVGVLVVVVHGVEDRLGLLRAGRRVEVDERAGPGPEQAGSRP